MNINELIDDIIRTEGGYSNDPTDAGGETIWGITAVVARANGYHGNMKDMPQSVAKQIYLNKYWLEPHFDRVDNLSSAVAVELADTGVNCGISFASGILQEALNLLNRQEADYKDVSADKSIGPATLAALASYLVKRGKEGEVVLVRMLNVMQGGRYIELAKTNPSQERFIYGWLLNRVVI